MKIVHWTLVVVAVVCGLSATSSGQYRANRSAIGITGFAVDTVSLTQPSNVRIGVFVGFDIRDVTARILPGEGYRVISQPGGKLATAKRGDSTSFSGVIQAEAKGMWEVTVEVCAIREDTIRIKRSDIFYILVSDTLNRMLSGYEYHRIMPKTIPVPPQPKEPIIKLPPLKSGVWLDSLVPDSLKRPRPGRGKRSGTFDVTGYLYYHDARDPQGQFKPAVNVAVVAWNENTLDCPSSSDSWLGTTLTDWSGCFSLSGLDNSDGDGSADPYLVFRTWNPEWVVRDTLTGVSYGWVSPTIRDASSNSTVYFGTTCIYGGDPYNEGAMWCFQYMNLGWNTAQAVGPAPPFIPCFWPGPHPDYSSDSAGIVFIARSEAAAVDIVNHEYGHVLMDWAYSWAPPAPGCATFYIDDTTCIIGAWLEGWAYFFAVVVTPDGAYDWDDGNVFSVEYPPWCRDGDKVPARVAGALLDLWDTNNDGLDQNSANTVSFETIYTLGVHADRDTSFQEFWNYLATHELTMSQFVPGVKCLQNNTINFANYSCTTCGDPDNNLLVNISDAVFLINFIFAGGVAPADCNYLYGKADADGSGRVNLTDAVYLINYIFAWGPCPHCLNMPCWTQ